MNYYQELESIYSKISKLDQASSILSWDVAVNIPKHSIESRSEQLATLKTIRHELLTSNKLGDCLSYIESSSLNNMQAKNVKMINKEREKALLSDPALIIAHTKATSISEMKWRDARINDDFKTYIPYLKEVINLTKEIYLPQSEKFSIALYDVMIDEYEPNLSSKQIEPLFIKLESFLKNFIPEVILYQQKNNYDIASSSNNFTDEVQFKLGKKFMGLLGFDFNRGRLDLSTHPQCGGYRDDTRITTRFDPNDLISGLMGVIHETGHALYSQNLPYEMRDQSVGSAIGMAMHESQSLIMEMQVARSMEFLEFASNQIKEITGFNKEEFEAKNLYKKLNKVSASLIRVDADEVTYPAHIIMRYKIEKKLIEENLSPAEIPEIWAEESVNILGIKPTNDKEGCLQDIHWPCGYFGYFPSYTIGSMMSAQFFSAAKSQIAGLMNDIKHGNFTEFTKWLNDNIHSQGSLYYSDELLKKVTGKDLDIDFYIAYLKNKFLP